MSNDCPSFVTKCARNLRKAGGQLWDSVMELCAERRFLEAYKQAFGCQHVQVCLTSSPMEQVIAEPEETCLLQLMKHTGPVLSFWHQDSRKSLVLVALGSSVTGLPLQKVQLLTDWMPRATRDCLHPSQPWLHHRQSWPGLSALIRPTAFSNCLRIRRLIHILSSPAKAHRHFLRGIEW